MTGAAKFRTFRKFRTPPAGNVRRSLLEAGVEVRKTCEWRTSKCCMLPPLKNAGIFKRVGRPRLPGANLALRPPVCGAVNQRVWMRRIKDGKRTATWTVKRCPCCGRFYQRDRSSAQGILKFGMMALAHQPRPVRFTPDAAKPVT